MSINPELWGPTFWGMIHWTVAGYPQSPNVAQKMAFKRYFNALAFVLPCKECRGNFKKILNDFPIDDALESGEGLRKWAVDVHNQVNKHTTIGPPEVWTLNEADLMYRPVEMSDEEYRRLGKPLVGDVPEDPEEEEEDVDVDEGEHTIPNPATPPLSPLPKDEKESIPEEQKEPETSTPKPKPKPQQPRPKTAPPAATPTPSVKPPSRPPSPSPSKTKKKSPEDTYTVYNGPPPQTVSQINRAIRRSHMKTMNAQRTVMGRINIPRNLIKPVTFNRMRRTIQLRTVKANRSIKAAPKRKKRGCGCNKKR